MACCLMASSHYLNQWWFIIKGVLWLSPESIFTSAHEHNPSNVFKDHTLKITTSPRIQRVKRQMASLLHTWLFLINFITPIKRGQLQRRVTPISVWSVANIAKHLSTNTVNSVFPGKSHNHSEKKKNTLSNKSLWSVSVIFPLEHICFQSLATSHYFTGTSMVPETNLPRWPRCYCITVRRQQVKNPF